MWLGHAIKQDRCAHPDPQKWALPVNRWHLPREITNICMDSIRDPSDIPNCLYDDMRVIPWNRQRMITKGHVEGWMTYVTCVCVCVGGGGVLKAGVHKDKGPKFSNSRQPLFTMIQWKSSIWVIPSDRVQRWAVTEDCFMLRRLLGTCKAERTRTRTARIQQVFGRITLGMLSGYTSVSLARFRKRTVTKTNTYSCSYSSLDRPVCRFRSDWRTVMHHCYIGRGLSF